MEVKKEQQRTKPFTDEADNWADATISAKRERRKPRMWGEFHLSAECFGHTEHTCRHYGGLNCCNNRSSIFETKFTTKNKAEADIYIQQLFENLMMDYNKNVRPVKNASDALIVKFGANLCRLIDVDEVNQVLTTIFLAKA
uniref:Neurotransmitter-gated ion-channel ligand-binding domain-containing protein n=1 Tax=Parascaris equorum TaxID=6256 RepID=A0A914RT46_PAREQ